MNLHAIRLLPRSAEGWESGTLLFGRNTTLLLGPNGAGKTPLLRSLAYALGHPIELPRLVRDNCRAVKLVIATDEGHHTIERRFTSGLEAVVTDPAGVRTEFHEERGFSEWVLPMLGVPLRPLAGKNGDTVAPYMSVVAPMFMVDQDTGWTTSYVPLQTHQFVKDQREEVMRWLLDIPPRNRPLDRSAFEEAKTTQQSIQDQVRFKRDSLQALERELGARTEQAMPSGGSKNAVLLLKSNLSCSQSFLERLTTAESDFDVRTRSAVEGRDEIAFKVANIKRRRTQLADVRAEVSAELSALEQSEVAAVGLRALCGTEACPVLWETGRVGWASGALPAGSAPGQVQFRRRRRGSRELSATAVVCRRGGRARDRCQES